jgi:hypothetical protein
MSVQPSLVSKKKMPDVRGRRQFRHYHQSPPVDESVRGFFDLISQVHEIIISGTSGGSTPSTPSTIHTMDISRAIVPMKL